MHRVLVSLLSMAFVLVSAHGAGTVVLFEPSNPDIGPFPTDALTVADARQKTGLRVNLPTPDCQSEPSTCAEMGLINDVDGFNLQPRLKVRFSGEIDVHTLRLGIYVVWLEDLTDEEFGLQPAGHITPVNQVLYDPATNTAYAELDQILSQHHRYLLVVTNAVRDAQGDPVEPSTEYTACMAAQDAYCDRLREALNTAGSLFAPDTIVGASVFTTLSATAWLENARDRLEDTAAGAFLPATKNVFTLSQLSSVAYQRQTKYSPSEFAPAGLNLYFLKGVGRIGFGSFRSPDFLNDKMFIPTAATGEDVALPAEFSEIPFVVFLPDSPAPPGGYPVVIVGHGADMYDLQFGNAVAAGMASYGLATIAITAPGWGAGPESRLQISERSGNVTTLPYPGRAIDSNGDGTYDPGAGCTLLTGPHPIGNRDCTRQTTVDLLQLARAIRAGIDLDRDGAIDLDPARIYYAGYSLGAFYGTLFTAVSPDIPAAVIAAGGGSFADIRFWSAERARSRTMLGSRTPNLLNKGTDFDADYVLRYSLPEIIDVPGALAIQEFFERFEWLAMPGDPIAYAPHLRWSTLPGVPIKQVLFQYGRGDRKIPNPAGSALVRAANMQDTTSLYRHDLARTVWPDLTPNAHLFIFPTLPAVYPTNPFGQFVISALALDQQAGFLASGGTVIPDENGWTRMWFGLDLFEAPPVSLPEDPGF